MAGYNNYFPQSYTNGLAAYGAGATSTQNWAQPTTAQTVPAAINWVQGEAGARSVFVPAGQKALLMDSETNVFYIKASDVSGMPLPLRMFEYKEVGKVATAEAAATTPAQSAYVTHEELQQILAEFKPKTEPVKEPTKEPTKEVKGNEFDF